MRLFLCLVLALSGLYGCEVLLPESEGDDPIEDAGVDVDPEVDVDDFVPPEPVEGRTRAADGMPQVLVQSGTFTMGRDDGADHEGPAREVTLSADFWMDRHEVTVAQWQACVDAGACADNLAGTYAELGSCNWESDFDTSNPMNCVGTVGAEAYCAHVGARLPTEAEWEYAARGTAGSAWTFGEVADCRSAVWSVPGDCEKGGTEPVESRLRDTSPWGVRDMAGNVREWVADYYLSEAYEMLPDTDPVYTEETSHRVHRGGYFGDRNTDNLRSTFRHRSFPDSRQQQHGFRCVGGEP